MLETSQNLDDNFNGLGNNENQLIPNQNNNYGQYINSNLNQNQGFNNSQEPLINNENIQINIDEISLPVQSQNNNIDDETNKKYSIPPPFTNDENSQNIIISNNNNNIQQNIEINQNLDINLQNNQNINNNFPNNQNFNSSNLNYNQLTNGNLQNNLNFNSDLQNNQPINNNLYNNPQMNNQVNFQSNDPFQNIQGINQSCECYRRRYITISSTIGVICGIISYTVMVILYISGAYKKII